MNKLYENIRMLCREQNMSLSDLEKAVPLARNTLSNWSSKNPSWEKVAAVARHFNVSMDFLVGLSDKRLSSNDLGNAAAQIALAAEKLSLSELQSKQIVQMIELAFSISRQ